MDDIIFDNLFESEHDEEPTVNSEETADILSEQLTTERDSFEFENNDTIDTMKEFLLMMDDDLQVESKDSGDNSGIGQTLFSKPNVAEGSEFCKANKHSWVYGAGICRCKNCLYYLTPDGRVSRTATGHGTVAHVEMTSQETPIAVLLDNQEYYPEEFAETLKKASRKITTESTENEIIVVPKGIPEMISSLLKSVKSRGGILSQSNLNTISNLLNNNGLVKQWDPSFSSIELKLDTDEKHGIRMTVEPPRELYTDDTFAKRLLNGEATLGDISRISPKLTFKVSAGILNSLAEPDYFILALKSAVEFCGKGIDGASERILAKLILETEGRERSAAVSAVAESDLRYVLIPIWNKLFSERIDADTDFTKPVFGNEDSVHDSTTILPMLVNGVDKPDSERKLIAREMNKLIQDSLAIYDDREIESRLAMLSKKVREVFENGEKLPVEKHQESWVAKHCEPGGVYLEAFRKKAKRLKKIPADLVSYIIVEADAIRTVSDKAMIASYCAGKIELVEWYIELIDTQSPNYIVPHTREYLVNIRNQLMAAQKKILETPLKRPGDPVITVNYPKGYEG